jgi:hypothetical protein
VAAQDERAADGAVACSRGSGWEGRRPPTAALELGDVNRGVVGWRASTSALCRPTNPEGGVRQQDIDDNKYIATTLAKIR